MQSAGSGERKMKFSWEDLSKDGEFKRTPAQFKGRVSKEKWFASTDRYHLYLSPACPWSHRTMLAKSMLGLPDAMLSVEWVSPHLDYTKGWEFCRDRGDSVNSFKTLREIYEQTKEGYDGRVTVPVLYDKQELKVVCNESTDIVRMLPGFRERFIPSELERKILEVEEWMYNDFNNGVYKAGFAGHQHAYETACKAVFRSLDKMEHILSTQRWLCSDEVFTEADLFAFPTLYRFDAIYNIHFKCSVRRICDYPNVWDYARAIYQLPGVRDTCQMDHCKMHYYTSHRDINPKGIIPLTPNSDWEAPSARLTNWTFSKA
eukprot:ANDGO_03469.mRNA.1 Glutathionyl-hydroquinone reductase YqjG